MRKRTKDSKPSKPPKSELQKILLCIIIFINNSHFFAIHIQGGKHVPLSCITLSRSFARIWLFRVTKSYGNSASSKGVVRGRVRLWISAPRRHRRRRHRRRQLKKSCLEPNPFHWMCARNQSEKNLCFSIRPPKNVWTIDLLKLWSSVNWYVYAFISYYYRV